MDRKTQVQGRRNPDPKVFGSEQAATWLIEIKKDFAGSKSLSTRYTICKVPDWLRTTKIDAYTPQIFSIGPHHHGKKNLLAMEEHKWYYALSLLGRTHNEIDAFDDCGEAIQGLESEVRACYDEVCFCNDQVCSCNEDQAIDHKLAKVLLVDGCFILELFLRSYLTDGRDDDPILSNPRMILILMRDLVLLENQIPFIVLEKLLRVIEKHSNNHLPSLVELVLRFFFKKDWFKHEKMFDLKFENGVIKIPEFSIENSLFQNLIAMEQCVHGYEHYMTSYGLLMDYLVDTSKDVELLVQKKIIPHSFGDYEEVARLFNNICKQAIVRRFYFADLCEQIHGHYNTKWNRQEIFGT